MSRQRASSQAHQAESRNYSYQSGTSRLNAVQDQNRRDSPLGISDNAAGQTTIALGNGIVNRFSTG
jgi:hypothetical protein